MHRIVFLDAATLAGDIVLPKPDFPHEWTNVPATAPDQVVARAAEAEIVVVNKVAHRRRADRGFAEAAADRHRRHRL